MIKNNIFLSGFQSYEASKLEVFFELAEKRAPHWHQTTRLIDAHIVLLNALSVKDVEDLSLKISAQQKVIVVGESSFGKDWTVLSRPFKLMAILELLDNVALAVTDTPLKEVLQPVMMEPVVMQPAMTQPENPVDIVALSITQPITSTLAATALSPKIEEPKIKEVDSIGQEMPTMQVSAAQVSVIRPISVPKRLSPSQLISDIVAKELVKGVRDSVAAEDAVIGKVLLVDDSDIALKYMQNQLRHYSYECELAHSGEEALAMLQTNNYYFVFLDVMMTGLDGYKTCKAIKSNKAKRGPVPVVLMLTSRGGTIDKIRGTMSGCDAYLTKPLNDKKLSEVLAKFDISTITERWEAAHPYQPLVDKDFKTGSH